MREVMNIQQLSEYLGVGESILWQLKSRHEIPFIKIGNRTVFTKKKIDEWLDDQTVTDIPMRRVA